MLGRMAALWLTAVVFPLGAAELQGYLAAWNCVKKIVKDDAEQTFKNVRELLSKSPTRDRLYVIVTGELKGNLIKVSAISLL